MGREDENDVCPIVLVSYEAWFVLWELRIDKTGDVLVMNEGRERVGQRWLTMAS